MPVVDLAFRLVGSSIPADHGYALFASLSHLLPSLHSDRGVGIHPIRGRLVGNRGLMLTRGSRLVVRVPAERIGGLLGIAGKTLDVAGCVLTVGPPEVWSLKPCSTLYSRLITIRGFMEPDPFLEAARRQLADLGIQGHLEFVRRRRARALEGRTALDAGSPLRRTLTIRGRVVVGYAVEVRGLSVEDSLVLQERGLGGRRRFGCGLFVPPRWEAGA